MGGVPDTVELSAEGFASIVRVDLFVNFIASAFGSGLRQKLDICECYPVIVPAPQMNKHLAISMIPHWALAKHPGKVDSNTPWFIAGCHHPRSSKWV